MPKHHSRILAPAGRGPCRAAHKPPAGAGPSGVAGRALKCSGRAWHIKMTAAPWISPAFNLSSLNHRARLGWPGPYLASPASSFPLFIPFFFIPSPCPPHCDLLILSLLHTWICSR